MEALAAKRPHCQGACACQRPASVESAVELWLYADAGHVRHALCRALDDGATEVALEQGFVKVREVPAVGDIVDRAAAALSPTERNAVKVAWMVAGNDPFHALINAQTLTVVQAKLRHGWFTALLDGDGLYMHFQPIVSLRQPDVLAHEALVRGRHDDREISGGEIIAAAQEAELLVPLDAQTRIKAVEHFDATGLAGKLFINFQPSAIYNPAYCLRTTFAAINRSRLRPQDIVFEVTESEGATDLAHLKEIVETYRAHGLAVAMDDMGAGHSSLERLLSLRPDFVKIDKSIVRDVVTDAMSSIMISSVVKIAATEGCRVIAEGIETMEQRDTLRELGVELGQGYLFARPGLRPQVVWPD